MKVKFLPLKTNINFDFLIRKYKLPTVKFEKIMSQYDGKNICFSLYETGCLLL